MKTKVCPKCNKPMRYVDGDYITSDGDAEMRAQMIHHIGDESGFVCEPCDYWTHRYDE